VGRLLVLLLLKLSNMAFFFVYGNVVVVRLYSRKRLLRSVRCLDLVVFNKSFAFRARLWL
jgi:hypothetical protein